MLELYLLLAAASLTTGTPDGVPDAGRSIAQVRRFARGPGEKLWNGYGSAPFEFLLIAGDRERLFCRAVRPAGFMANGIEPASGCPVFIRARSGLPDTLLAAMPVFGPPSTIVMGTPQSTGRSGADWTRTILHEHFHEWQDALPGFYGRLAKLDLSNNDQTGMWMLNYPFPYSDPSVIAAFNEASHALGRAVAARGKRGFGAAFSKYLAARSKLARTAGEKNWRYAELELWKEGVARWTEIELGKLYPDAAVRHSALDLEQKTRAWLQEPDLPGAGREFVYPIGAAEAMLLQTCNSRWRRDYLKQVALGPLLQSARRNCHR